MQLLAALPVFATAFGLALAQTTTEPVTGTLGNATVVENNPPGVVYTATLPSTEFNNPSDPRGNVKGSISAVAAPSGMGVKFTVNFSNLPTSGGPFLYHLHVAPVDANGNCTNTLGHLDPFIRGETPTCNAALPQTCQVGDLSGKYGKITSDPFTATYTDEFASTVDGLGSFFGNRSVVVHFGNKTRITCASFVKGTSTVTQGNGSSTTTGGPIQFMGAASKSSMAGLGALAGAAVAAVFAL